jgi:hypothetical protein
MSLLHHALGDHEMELALSCMDSHGYITPEQVGAAHSGEVVCTSASLPAGWHCVPRSVTHLVLAT